MKRLRVILEITVGDGQAEEWHRDSEIGLSSQLARSIRGSLLWTEEKLDSLKVEDIEDPFEVKDDLQSNAQGESH